MSTQKSIMAGKTAADKQPVIGWAIFGILLAIVAIPFAYLMKPRLDPRTLAEQDDDVDPSVFEMAYVDQMKSRQTKSAWLGLLIAVGLVFVLMNMGSGSDDSYTTDTSLQKEQGSTLKSERKKVSKPDRTVSLAEFNRIKNGMSYKEVVAIIGFEGEVMSESTIMDIKTVMYSWENGGFSFSNMNAMFQNDKLISKAQFGLE